MLDARAVGLVKQRAGQRELFGRVDLVGGVLTGDGLRHPGQGQIAASLEPADEPEASAAIGGDPGIEERLRTVIEIMLACGEVVDETAGGVDVGPAACGDTWRDVVMAVGLRSADDVPRSEERRVGKAGG